MSESTKSKTSYSGAFLLLVLLASAAALYVFNKSFFFHLESYEKAVIFNLGKVDPDPIITEGFKLRAPWPIQEVAIINTEKDRRVQIGFTAEDKGKKVHNLQQALMLTRDANLVDMEVEINYTISDVVNYVIKMENPVESMTDIAEAALNSVVGVHTVQEILTSQKAEIAKEVLDKLQAIVEEYELGVSVSRVQLLQVLNPEEVRAAYESVESAKQDSVISVEKALAYENRELPAARADSLELVKKAEAFAYTRIAQAEGEVAEFNALYDKYRKGKKVMRKRLFLETLEEVLPGKRKIILDGKGQNLNMLNLGGVK